MSDSRQKTAKNVNYIVISINLFQIQVVSTYCPISRILHERLCSQVSLTFCKYSELRLECLTGVISPIMKLLNQFEHVERATPFARRLEGNISDGIAQGTGPQDAPKEIM